MLREWGWGAEGATCVEITRKAKASSGSLNFPPEDVLKPSIYRALEGPVRKFWKAKYERKLLATHPEGFELLSPPLIGGICPNLLSAFTSHPLPHSFG